MLECTWCGSADGSTVLGAQGYRAGAWRRDRLCHGYFGCRRIERCTFVVARNSSVPQQSRWSTAGASQRPPSRLARARHEPRRRQSRGIAEAPRVARDSSVRSCAQTDSAVCPLYSVECPSVTPSCESTAVHTDARDTDSDSRNSYAFARAVSSTRNATTAPALLYRTLTANAKPVSLFVTR